MENRKLQKLKPLFELGLPGQYFKVDVMGQGVYISFLPKRPRGCTKFHLTLPYFTYYPFNNPRELYNAFHNLRLGMLYKDLEIEI